MNEALKLALSVKGMTYPNPCVGSVIVKNDNIISKGATQKAGSDHAEIVCLKKAGSKAKNSEMYVTLEPCSHFGKTPPCVDAIIKAGIKKVIIASKDPNQLVNGRSISILKNKKIKVIVDVLKKEAEQVNEEFFKFIKTGIPFIALKYAMTLDGKISSDSGNSKWITNSESRDYVQLLRKQYNSILVGRNTINLDNPLLNCRLNAIDKSYQPVRIIIAKSGNFEKNRKVFKGNLKTFIFTTKKGREKIEKDHKLGGNLNIHTPENAAFNLEYIVKEIGKLSIVSVLVEGGSFTITEFLKSGFVDKIFVFIAPKIIGGKIYSPVKSIGINKMNDAILFRGKWHNFSTDVCFEGYINE